MTAQVLAHNPSKCRDNHHKNCNSSHYVPNYVVSQITTLSYVPINNCSEHQIEKQTTVTYYSNSSASTIQRYTAYDYNGNPIIDNCISMEHVVYNNKCYFVIEFYDNKILSFSSKAAIISRDNNFVINRKYNRLTKIDNNKYIAKVDGKYGIIDIEENQIVPIVYDSLDSLSNNLYRTKVNGMYGVINANGKIILNCKYDTIKKLGSHHYQIKQNKKWGILSNNGELLAPVKYKDVKISKNTLYVKNDNNAWIQLQNSVNY